MANMSAKEVEAMIRKLRDEKQMTWGQIADHLKDKGYKSPKTSRPLAEASVRYTYFYGQKGDRKQAEATPSGGAAAKLNTISDILRLKMDDKTRVALISQIVEKAD